MSDPHAAIASEATGVVWNLVAAASDKARDVTAALAREQPDRPAAWFFSSFVGHFFASRDEKMTNKGIKTRDLRKSY